MTKTWHRESGQAHDSTCSSDGDSQPCGSLSLGTRSERQAKPPARPFSMSMDRVESLAQPGGQILPHPSSILFQASSV
ncbi:hypothetical protein Pfo_003684, partial [Paulownia fortunei]